MGSPCRKDGDTLRFDFDKFSMITASVYPQSNPYSREDALSVFHYYFEKYEDFTGHPHPPIKAAQIKRLCECMPFLDCEGIGGSIADIAPDCYPVLIDKYFATKFRNCDRNIHHFLSGRVRELRFFEELY